MGLDKFIVVFVVLIGRTCLSKILINSIRSNGFDKLEDAAIKILTTCYPDKDKTIVLVGNFPDPFIERLSSHRSFSLVLYDNRRPMDNILFYRDRRLYNSLHKVHIFVTTSASYIEQATLNKYIHISRYQNKMASVLVIAWSPEQKYVGCNDPRCPLRIMYNNVLNNRLNINVLGHHFTRGTVLYTSNPFTNQAPKPWQLVKIYHTDEFSTFSLFERKYLKSIKMCKNLDFDRTRDLGGYAIKVAYFYQQTKNKNELKTVRQLHRNKRRFTHVKDFSSSANEIADHIGIESYRTRPSTLRELVTSAEYVESPREWLEGDSQFNLIDSFVAYVNGTEKVIYQYDYVGVSRNHPEFSISSVPQHLWKWTDSDVTDAYGVSCKFLITQFRGYKSQLRKILDVIDSYSWYGMYVTFIVTLIFFKYFMHQPLLIGILNLCRLTCNTGLTTLPPNVASQIYLALLLCFVVTMQGIFCGNLAALLTQDIPVRQVNSVQDLVDLNYTVYVAPKNSMLLNDSVSQDRIVELKEFELCYPPVLRAPWLACLAWGSEAITFAEKHNLHVSDRPVTCAYRVSAMKWNCPLQERMNTFLRIALGGGFLLSLDAIVVEKRFLERDAEEVLVEPRIMMFDDLAFAFRILSIGFGLSVIAFIGEIIFYRIHRGVTSTRVVELNRSKRTKVPSFFRHIIKRLKKKN